MTKYFTKAMYISLMILVLLFIEGILYKMGANLIFETSSYNVFGWIAQISVFIFAISLGFKLDEKAS